MFDVAVGELKKARVDGRAAGLAVEPEEFVGEALPPAENASIEIGEAAKMWNDVPFLKRSPYAVTWGNVVNEKDLAVNQPKAVAAMTEIQNILALVHKGALKPKCAFPRDYNTAQVAFPEQGILKDAAKALSAKAVYAAKKQDLATVKTCLVDIQKLAQMCATDKIIVGHVQAVNISKLGLRTGQRILGEIGTAGVPAVEAAANEVPTLTLADCLANECLAGVGVLRNINVLDLPGMDEYRDAAAQAQRGDATLTAGKVARAFEARHLQFWTKVKNKSEGMSNDDLGNLMDDMVFASTKQDATYAYITNGPSYAQVGNALQSLAEQKKACLATVALIRGENEAEVMQKYGVKKEAVAGGGYTVYSTAYKVLAKPGKKVSRVSYEFVYPFKGK